MQINTAELEPGSYQLLISQQDGKSHPVEINLLPNPPKIENLPILANQGATAQHYVLKGERLGLFTKLETPAAVLKLDPASADGTERNITVQLELKPQAGHGLRGFRLPAKSKRADSFRRCAADHGAFAGYRQFQTFASCRLVDRNQPGRVSGRKHVDRDARREEYRTEEHFASQLRRGRGRARRPAHRGADGQIEFATALAGSNFSLVRYGKPAGWLFGSGRDQ